jgi:hypothetical protein
MVTRQALGRLVAAVALFICIGGKSADSQSSAAAPSNNGAPVFGPTLYKSVTPGRATSLLMDGDRFLDREGTSADQKQRMADRVFGYMLLGFIAEISKDHADWIPALIANANALTDRGRMLLIIALSSSRSSQATEALNTLRSRGMGELIDQAAKKDMTNTLTFPVVAPDILSTYMGAYSASGNQNYIVGMIDGLEIAMPGGRQPNLIMTQLIPLQLMVLAKGDPAVRETIGKGVADAKYNGISVVLKSVLEQAGR